MKDKKYFYISILFALIVLSIAITHTQYLMWDESVYLANARNHITQSNFTEDFRYPLLEYVLAGVWLITGESILIAKIFITLLATASIGLTYLISREYIEDIYSMILCVLLSISPLFVYWGNRIFTDVPALFFILLAFYCIQISYKQKYARYKYIFIFLGGILSGLAFLMRFTFALFPVAVLACFLYTKKFKSIIIFGIAGMIILGPWLVYNQITYNDPIWDLKAQYDAIERWTYTEPVIKQVNNLFTSINIFILLLFIAGGYYIIKSHITEGKSKKFLNDGEKIMLFYILLCLVYYVFIAKLKDARYLLSFTPFMFILAFIGLKKIFKHMKKIPRVCGIVLITLVSIYMLINIASQINHEYYCNENDAIMQSIKYLDANILINNRSVDINSEYLFSNAWVWYGYYLNVKANSLWHNDTAWLINTYTPKYIIYTDSLVYRYYNQSNIAKNAVLMATFNGSCNELVYVYRVK